MNKRILAFILAVILAFLPMGQVNATGVSGNYVSDNEIVVEETEETTVDDSHTEETLQTEPSDVMPETTEEVDSVEESVSEEETEAEDEFSTKEEATEETLACEEELTGSQTTEEVSVSEDSIGENREESADESTLLTEDILLEIENSEESAIILLQQPERITELTVGESAKLQITAESALGKTLKYQWYQTSSYYRPTNHAVKISKATSSKVTVAPAKRGIQYYFCIISDGTNKAMSDCVAVVTADKGYKVCSVAPQLDTADDIDKLEEDGWKWEGSSKTLTLNNLDLLVPFAESNVLNIDAGTTVIAEGTNYIIDNDGCFLVSESETPEENSVTFKGTGKLITGNFRIGEGVSGYSFTFTDGITVDSDKIGFPQTNIVLDNATYLARNYAETANLTLRNGAYLEAANGIKVTSDVEVEPGCLLVCGNTANVYGNFTIEEDATVIVDNCLSLTEAASYKNPSTILTIYGTLQIRTGNNNTSPLQVYSEDESPLVLGDEVRVIEPEGAVFEKRTGFYSNYSYAFRYNDSYYFDTLIIGKSDVTASKKINGGKTISGKPVCGNVLKAPALEQKAATVSYQWQYANKKDGVWNNISNARNNTYTVEAKYHNYYLRVVTQGIGNYTGQIISTPVGPVVGNDCYLSSVWFIDGDGKENLIGEQPFDGSDFDYGNYFSKMTDDGLFRYFAEPVNEKATVTIRNITTGFSQVGRIADVPVIAGINEIEIEVSYGLKSNIYTIKHEIEQEQIEQITNPNLRLNAIDFPITASWMEEDGLKEYTVETGKNVIITGINAGTEITLTSEPSPGTYVFQYIGVEGVPDKSKAGSPLTFILEDNIIVSVRDMYTMAYPPEGLTAGWQLEDGIAQVKVQSIPIPDTSPAKYVGIHVEVLDENGTTVFSKTVGKDSVLPGTDGLYSLDVNNLDSTKQYTVMAYNEYINTYACCSREEQTSYYTLEPRKTVELYAESEYVVLKPNDTIEVPIIYNGYEGSLLTLENGFDSDVLSGDATMIKKDADGNYALQIKAANVGTTYLTLRGEDYYKDDVMQYVFASLRVEVSDADEASAFSLGETKGSLNLYDDSAITVPVYRMDCRHDIESAEFTQEALNDKFVISVLDDRTLKIEPKVPADDGSIDYEKWVTQKGRAGTFSSKIRVKYNGLSEMESDEEFKITLMAKKPKMKVSTLNFNSFYTEQTKSVPITVTGESIEKIQIDTVKNSEDNMACPAFLSVNENEKSFVLDGNNIPSDSISTRVYIKIWPKGYRIPLQTKLNVKVSYQKPVIKFEKSTIVLPDQEYVTVLDTKLKLVSGNKKESIQDIGVESLRVLSHTEFMQLGSKERKSHIDRKYIDIYSFDNTTCVAVLRFYNKPGTGKAYFYTEIKNGKEPVLVKVSTKMNKKAVIKASKSTITFDRVYGSYLHCDQTSVKFTTNVTGYEFNPNHFTSKVYKVGDETKHDYVSDFYLSWHSSSGSLSIRRRNDLEKGTYKLYVSAINIEKPAVVTIKVIESKAPVLKASAKEITVNRLHGYSYGKDTVYLSIPKKYDEFIMHNEDIKVFRPDNTSDDDESLYVYCDSWDSNKNAWKIIIYPTETSQKGTYKIVFGGQLYGGCEISPVTVKVKVTQKAPSPKMTPGNIVLNKDLGDFDDGYAEINYPYNFLPQTGIDIYNLVSVTDSKGKDASDRLDVNASYGYVAVKCNEKTEYGATYKIKLAYNFLFNVTKYDTLTVKIAPKDAKISVKLKPGGYMDVTRPEEERLLMDFISTNWNNEVYAGRENTPYYEWEIYAKNGKKLITMQDGAINDEGLVATGKSTDLSLNSKNWFYNSAPYGIGLMINNINSTAWENNQIAPHYTYTIKTSLHFPSLEKEVQVPELNFKLKKGSTKFVLNEKSIQLNKADDYARALITITDKNINPQEVMDIDCVEVEGNKKVPVSNAVEIVPLYQVNESTTYAIYWKDKTAANVKGGTVKINVYLKGNNSKWKKPNASFNLKVNVK